MERKTKKTELVNRVTITKKNFISFTIIAFMCVSFKQLCRVNLLMHCLVIDSRVRSTIIITIMLIGEEEAEIISFLFSPLPEGLMLIREPSRCILADCYRG